MELLGYLALLYIFLTILSLLSFLVKATPRTCPEEKVLNRTLIILYLLMSAGLIHWLIGQ